MKIIIDEFTLTYQQAEILFNIEIYKTENDIKNTSDVEDVELKNRWLADWKGCISNGFSRVFKDDNLKFQRLKLECLDQEIRNNNPEETWFKLVLLEAMLFEPYFPLKWDISNGENISLSKEYSHLEDNSYGYDSKIGDQYLETEFAVNYKLNGCVEKFRQSYEEYHNKLISSSGLLQRPETNIEMLKDVLICIPDSNSVSPKQLEEMGMVYSTFAYIGGNALVVEEPNHKNKIAAGGAAAIEYFLDNSIDDMLKSKNMATDGYILFQSAKLLVSKKEIFGPKDENYFCDILNEFKEKGKEIKKVLAQDVMNKKDETQKLERIACILEAIIREW